MAMRFSLVCVKPCAKQKAYKEAQSWTVNLGACYYPLCIFFRSLIFLFLLNTHTAALGDVPSSFPNHFVLSLA